MAKNKKLNPGTKLNQLWEVAQRLTTNMDYSVDNLAHDLQSIFPIKCKVTTEGDPEEPKYIILTMTVPRGYQSPQDWFQDEECQLLLYGIMGTMGNFLAQANTPEMDWQCPMEFWTEKEVKHIIRFRCSYGS